jgi:hypothetical protein
MLALTVRLLVAAIAIAPLAPVPVYPGAMLDAAASNEASAAHPKFPYKVYVTPDSYEKVVAFYKAKGASQAEGVSVGNDANQKMARFSASDTTIDIHWPADVKDGTGRIISRSGTRISIGD